jgi:hypothetical protein
VKPVRLSLFGAIETARAPKAALDKVRRLGAANAPRRRA